MLNRLILYSTLNNWKIQVKNRATLMHFLTKAFYFIERKLEYKGMSKWKEALHILQLEKYKELRIQRFLLRISKKNETISFNSWFDCFFAEIVLPCQ